ncbi:class I SAM-dependent rRNA methyltransferase [Aquisalimonas asiatica]|uniref:SAM-dependent methyltransferase n=1 Tax=Aquisalimonas asiatica TaxID=406100 RepID=A0A1H8TRV8_9GAMM|nr:class I SAM-dependent rRNA methyltransferase [Aquisalimonas asiatica]SEO93364.1 SAM-dependent methyltransferase [Aquisalimonas asiatica]
MAQTRPSLYLKQGEERRLRAGHLWVFSNEVDSARSPLKAFEPGQDATLRDHSGRPLGTAYVNPHSLICARLISRDPERGLDESLLVHRLNLALALRERHFPTPHYRLVHGDGDGLSGLVIDRYGDTCVVQPNTAGMDRALDAIISALQRVLAPAHVLVRADSPLRELEGLESTVDWAGGAGPDALEIIENGLTFSVPATTGQKTGWYYDHRANRARIAPYVRGMRVLDVFSYAGAWGLQALAAGAESLVAVDSSSDALDALDANAERNGLGEHVTGVEGDAFDVLKALRQDGERFDAVIVDPPAFVKRKKDLKAGLSGYRRLNQLALQVLEKNGVLISASCSAHVDEQQLLGEVLGAARHVDRSLQLVERGGQAPDHPEHPAIPESRYLKALFTRVAPAWSTP